MVDAGNRDDWVERRAVAVACRVCISRMLDLVDDTPAFARTRALLSRADSESAAVIALADEGLRMLVRHHETSKNS